MNWNSPCNSDYGNSGLKAYVSRQIYCTVSVAVVTTNRYESTEFTDINSIHYGEWRITAHMPQKLQLKTLICVETNKFRQNRAKEYLRTAFFWVITQREEINSYRRFGKPIIPIFKGKDSWPLKMGMIGCSETSLRNYQCALTQKNVVFICFAAEVYVPRS